MARLPRVLLLFAALAAGGGCATNARVVVIAGPGDPAQAQAAFAWEEADYGVERGTLEVPRDYTDPSKGTFTLSVARHRATHPSERIGTLLVNPGGPGFGGTDFAFYADKVYGKELLERFDIVGWDPRGTGGSTPAIDCIPAEDYDHYFGESDITPDTPDERQQIIDLAWTFAAVCDAATNRLILPYVGTNNSARDMDAIRRALGEPTISYFGFSYGSELGATWATLFPGTVRAAVLDGASDPNADLQEAGLQQAAGFEHTFDTFLGECSADRKCAFHNDGDAAGAFDRLMAAIDEHPLPANTDRPKLTRGAALTGVAQAMYDKAHWPELAQALADAQAGDGRGLQDLYDAYYHPSLSGNELEAFQAISCMDTAERPTVAEEDAEAVDLQRVAPRLSPGTTGSYMCTFWPPSTDPRTAITAKGAGPILVMGTTGDPATPLASTEKMAAALEDGRLVTVRGDQHTGYGINACSRAVVDDYLVDPQHNAPKDGTHCD